jgi:hypothetical protein
MTVITRLDKYQVLVIYVFTHWILVRLLIEQKKRNMDGFSTGKAINL